MLENAKKTLSDNKTVIRRRILIGVGAVAGLALAGVIISKINNVEEIVETVAEEVA